MLTIGLVARLYGITAKTLRHYDAIGLFTPARVGEDNLYRLYAPEQLPELRTILFLRSMGLSLDSIQEMKRNGLLEDAGYIKGLLQQRAEAIQDELGSLNRQLHDIHRMVEYMTSTGGIPMEPKVVEQEAFTVVGMAWNSQCDEGDIPAMWQRFIPREHEIEGKQQPAVSYGICIPTDTEAFTYVAGFEANGEQLPEGMIKVNVPAQRYAVFTHKGRTEGMGETYELIYGKWLSLQGLKVVKGIDYERYDERFHGPESERSEVDIYIPIE
ncbi:GyrI-like domain-containing protein [Paenibacillus sp. 1011MAR3C5]|uniref:MerR family transcriptional regulator n=1 Tax=Paenibacillus sp. 1011MAR3C5 TaxID=1675787 RepID=UPI0016043811|nr:GyrI-like domain-containing protein [Paenibacillus sp. 1011MAR3C5]